MNFTAGFSVQIHMKAWSFRSNWYIGILGHRKQRKLATALNVKLNTAKQNTVGSHLSSHGNQTVPTARKSEIHSGKVVLPINHGRNLLTFKKKMCGVQITLEKLLRNSQLKKKKNTELYVSKTGRKTCTEECKTDQVITIYFIYYM